MQAKLVLIPKMGQDISESYRPISLLNTAFKLLTAILTARLNRFLSCYIYVDQTGFIPSRQLRDNIRRIYNIIHWIKSEGQPPTVFYFIDAQKAFDTVDWGFLEEVLRRMGFGCLFLSWISLIYSAQVTEIYLQGLKSEDIHLQRGMRQGCPLSPLLFNVVIQTLASAIWACPDIKGVQTPAGIHTISLYADDVVLFLQDPVL